VFRTAVTYYSRHSMKLIQRLLCMGLQQTERGIHRIIKRLGGGRDCGGRLWG